MMDEKRGFITIATGAEYYYQLAANLLMSYRCKTKNPYPFAIIAEEENQYTALFDDVILTKDATRSFLDKFLLLKLCPYEETIFFDADILAYNDLNKYWDIFRDATDFSAIGGNYKLDQQGAWYDIDGIGKYGQGLTYKVKVHMGVCFIRKSPAIEKLYRDCMDILADYNSLTIIQCPDSRDEATLGIAMPMNQMRAVEEKPEYFAVYPCLSHLKASISRDILEYKNVWGTSVKSGGLLIHFGSLNTKKPLYRFEVECLRHLADHTDQTLLFRIRYGMGLRRISLAIEYAGKTARKIINRKWKQWVVSR